jgi:adenylosuccinate synthase
MASSAGSCNSKWQRRGRVLGRWGLSKDRAGGGLALPRRESGAKIGMVSTGPERDQTMTLPAFEEALKA